MHVPPRFEHRHTPESSTPRIWNLFEGVARIESAGDVRDDGHVVFDREDVHHAQLAMQFEGAAFISVAEENLIPAEGKHHGLLAEVVAVFDAESLAKRLQDELRRFEYVVQMPFEFDERVCLRTE